MQLHSRAADRPAGISRTPQAGRNRDQAHWTMGGLVLLAATVALAFLGRRGLFPDEAVSIGIARSDWSSFIDALTSRETNMALYHVILRGWVRLGHGEAFARALALVDIAALAPVGIGHHRLAANLVEGDVLRRVLDSARASEGASMPGAAGLPNRLPTEGP